MTATTGQSLTCWCCAVWWLCRLLLLLPWSASLLCGVLVDRFPSSRQSTEAWLLYVGNQLKVAEYAPALRERLLICIVERLTQLDVELTSQQQLLATEQQHEGGEQDEEHLLDGDAPPSSSSSSAELPLVTLVDRRLLQSADGQRVDAVLCTLLSYLQRLSTSSTPSPSSSSPSSLCDDVFAALLRVFKSSILPTVGVREVQWLLFYQCSLRHAHAEAFLRWLLDHIFDREANPAVRLSCVDYAQSFIARASFFRQPSAMSAFTHILQWTTSYAHSFATQQQDWRAQQLAPSQHQQDARSSSPSPPFIASSSPSSSSSRSSFSLPLVGVEECGEHALFYRSFQCLLYVFVYRWRAFEDEMDKHAAASVERRRHRKGEEGEDEQGDEEVEEEERGYGQTAEEADVDAAHARLLDGSLTRADLRALLHYLVHSPLDPLRYSTPFIVHEFSRLARALQLYDLRPALRRQRWRRRAEEAKEREGDSDASAAALARLLLSSHSALSEGSGLLGHRSSSPEQVAALPELRQPHQPSALSAAFPFDPYFLPASAGVLLPLYSHYQATPPPPPSPAAQQRRAAAQLRSAPSAAPRSLPVREKRKVMTAVVDGDADMEHSDADAARTGSREERQGGRERRQRMSVDWMEEEKEGHSRLTLPNQERSVGLNTAVTARRTGGRKMQEAEERKEEDEVDDEQKTEGAFSAASADTSEGEEEEEEEESEEDEGGECGVEASRLLPPSFSPGFGPSLSSPALLAAPSTSPSTAASARNLSHFLSSSSATVRRLSPSRLVDLSPPPSPDTASLSLLPPSARTPVRHRTANSAIALRSATPASGRSLASFAPHTARP